ncbi:heme ABC transporter ATP-binding protein [Methylophaga sp.]|uniref:heme ABC transporter ATP-binding protein n=1 Tax=Methylophaga sp. TaxID=2024840 RepID=UPI003A943A34
MTSLTLNHLNIDHGGRSILHIEHADVEPGEFIAVLGPNGAGKTSLFRAITSEWKPSSGHVFLHDKNVNEWSRRERAKHLGILPQSSQLTFPFSASEVVAIGATPLSLSADELAQQTRFWMEKTDTWQFADRFFTSLSGGERQRVQLARILLQVSQAEKPPVILLDEPTSAQDLGQQHHLLQLVRQLSHESQFSIVAILHDLNQATRYADKIWLLNQGKMFAQGSPQAILTPDTVSAVWGYVPEKLITQAGNNVLI